MKKTSDLPMVTGQSGDQTTTLPPLFSHVASAPRFLPPLSTYACVLNFNYPIWGKNSWNRLRKYESCHIHIKSMAPRAGESILVPGKCPFPEENADPNISSKEERETEISTRICTFIFMLQCPWISQLNWKKLFQGTRDWCITKSGLKTYVFGGGVLWIQAIKAPLITEQKSGII